MLMLRQVEASEELLAQAVGKPVDLVNLSVDLLGEIDLARSMALQEVGVRGDGEGLVDGVLREPTRTRVQSRMAAGEARLPRPCARCAAGLEVRCTAWARALSNRARSIHFLEQRLQASVVHVSIDPLWPPVHLDRLPKLDHC
jgi:hypothetical protein